MNLDRPVARLFGLTLILVCLALFNPEANTALQRLVVPLLMAAGAWALVQNLAAVALAVAVLGAIHWDLASGDWIDRFAWPVLTVLAGITFLWILLGRFRQRIRDTHEQRWLSRQDRTRKPASQERRSGQREP